jgi:hypothetical protein
MDNIRPILLFSQSNQIPEMQWFTPSIDDRTSSSEMKRRHPTCGMRNREALVNEMNSRHLI